MANAFEPSRRVDYRMTGDSDYTQYPDDGRTYPETRDIELVKEEFRVLSKRRAIQGVVLLLGPLLMFIIPPIVPVEYMDQAFFGSLFIGFILAIVGVFLLFYYGMGMALTLKGFEILERLGPPNPQFIKRLAVIKVNDVYLITHGTSGHIYAVAFRGSPQFEPNNKAKLPRTFFRWEKQIDVGGMKLYRREDTFSVPISLEESVTGDAVLYGAPFQPSRYQWAVPEFTREELMAIVESITEDASRLY